MKKGKNRYVCLQICIVNGVTERNPAWHIQLNIIGKSQMYVNKDSKLVQNYAVHQSAI